MAKCKDCGTIYCVYGGSKDSVCPSCNGKNISTTKEGRLKDEINPCIHCYFDWKDFCSDEKRTTCKEKLIQKMESKKGER